MCATSNFLAYVLFKIQTSEPYLDAAFHVLLCRCSFVLTVIYLSKCLLIAEVIKIRYLVYYFSFKFYFLLFVCLPQYSYCFSFSN